MGSSKTNAKSFVAQEAVCGWCKALPIDSRYTFLCLGKRPTSQHVTHRVVAFHLRSGGGDEPRPFRFEESNTHQFVISYTQSKVTINLFQCQICIPDLEFGTADNSSRIIAEYIVRLLDECDEYLARDYGKKKLALFGRGSAEDMPSDYLERRQFFWSRAIAFRLAELIKTGGVR